MSFKAGCSRILILDQFSRHNSLPSFVHKYTQAQCIERKVRHSCMSMNRCAFSRNYKRLIFYTFKCMCGNILEGIIESKIQIAMPRIIYSAKCIYMLPRRRNCPLKPHQRREWIFLLRSLCFQDIRRSISRARNLPRRTSTASRSHPHSHSHIACRQD